MTYLVTVGAHLSFRSTYREFSMSERDEGPTGQRNAHRERERATL